MLPLAADWRWRPALVCGHGSVSPAKIVNKAACGSRTIAMLPWPMATGGSGCCPPSRRTRAAVPSASSTLT